MLQNCDDLAVDPKLLACNDLYPARAEYFYLHSEVKCTILGA